MHGQSLTTLILFCASVTVLGTCPPGFFQHEESCYVTSKYCNMVQCNGTLSTSEVWLGGTDMLNEGEWMWVKTFQPITYTRWTPNEPNNGAKSNNQHCLGMKEYDDFKWDDNTCSNMATPLCERPIDLPWGKDVVKPNQIIG